MRTTSVTTGIPVKDLPSSRTWYEKVLEMEGPTLEPVEGVAEYEVGGTWLQLNQLQGGAPGGWVFRIGVPDVQAEHERLANLGIAVGPIQHIEDVLETFQFADPDGNLLSLYTLEETQ